LIRKGDFSAVHIFEGLAEKLLDLMEFCKKNLANHLPICYHENIKGVTAHKVVSLPDWL